MDNVIATISVCQVCARYGVLECAAYYVSVIVNECMRDERKW